MQIITPDVVNSINVYAVCDFKTIQRGLSLFQAQRANIIRYTLDEATCRVMDKEEDFVVLIKLQGKKQLVFLCPCEAFDPKHLCRHVVASLLTLGPYLLSQGQDNWQYRLATALQETPRRASAPHRQEYAIIFGLHKEEQYSVTRYYMLPYKLKVSDWEDLRQFEADYAVINQYLEKEMRWQRYVEVPNQLFHPDGCINLPPEGVGVANMILQARRFYLDALAFTTYLPILGRIDAPIFLIEAQKFRRQLRVLADMVEIEAALGRAQDNFILQAGLEVNGQVFTTEKESLSILSNNPAWVIAGSFLAPIKNPQNLPLLSTFPVNIPAGQEKDFRERFLRDIAERMPVKGDVIAWEDVAGDPVPRLYLRDESNSLYAGLSFAYGDYEIAASLQPEERTVIDIPGSWGMVRVKRNVERENEYYQILTAPKYRLKRAGRENPPGTFELRARTHPFDFLVDSIPLLTQAGFEIFGEEKLKAGKINRNPPKISLHISSGLDWFDLEAMVHYGDQEVSLRDIYKALRKDERYVKLADGSIGQIPETWLARYRHLFALTEETETGLRVAEYHLPLVDTLLADAAETQLVPEFQQRREHLRSFDHIRSQPIPTGFVGELRPYQKAGLDWLHFLEEYGFGGCLADDMGLGKTIQVLAFLQSRRERDFQAEPDRPRLASLLVVPKSLLANWQREAARFTPDLRFLEYVGNTRLKDHVAFTDYDVVLTTYGTMLRDIELLRGYRFDYAILDESQAIKNPMAQASKAARLLNAAHRLVMTGTPVENNTYELWSQFAFLNPGLLGSQEYFRRQFTFPIESDHNEEIAHLLRQLIYPFILRRTKEQVAPDLPPRSERVLYTDMEPAQKKLYTQTRDRYRGILLGLVEEEGVDNVRMKILEGLLRLRQISIHPALVEPAYRGGAPKFELLFEIIQTLKAENHKALIFSQFVETLRLVREGLDVMKIPYAYLDGRTHDRQAQVDRFQGEPELRLFLISLKAGGVGLNLTAADYVIHLDPWWNPAVEMQASDRAHRIGQDKPVFIYKIIARDTVEEKILQLQEKKRALVQQLISTEESFFKSLTASDVKALFS
jgi:non-specific serine/threonine protein kinase